MRYRYLKLFSVALLAGVAYAQPMAQAVPQIPATPPAPRVTVKKHFKADAASQSGSYLGVDPRDVTPDRLGMLRLNESRGVEVMMVDRDSPAGKAGLREHDVILGFNGKPVANADQLRRLLRETQPGKTVPVQLSRGGQQLTLNVALVKRPDELANMMPVVPMPPIPPLDLDIPSFTVLQFSTRNGVMVEDMTPQLADFFGVRNGGGVLVRSVDRGSIADSAGLKAGDVIVKAGNEPISCSSDWRRIMHSRHGSVPLGIVRDKHEQSVTLKLPDRSPESSLRFQLPEQELEQMRQQWEQQRPDLEKQLAIARSQLQTALAERQKAFDQAMKFRTEDLQRLQQQLHDSIEKALESTPVD